jgi:large subunit ribosomal protein L18e
MKNHSMLKKTNQRLTEIIRRFEESGRKEKKPMFRRIAEIIKKPRRLKAQINLYQIDKLCKENEIAVVPGKILGKGHLSKKIRLYALECSEKAKNKLENSGIEIFNIEKLLEDKPKNAKLVI